MSDGPDLHHFVQHHQLDVYEQGMARHGYAYGVDLRRSRWLASSTVGNPLVRAVDRAWPVLADHLDGEAVRDVGDLATHAPLGLLREIGAAMQLLRTPLPTVKLLRPEQRGRWPLVTPLGATRGGALWLILDAEGLAALTAEQRMFLLGAGLGHLHCDHAVFFTAHLLASRREGQGKLHIQALRTALIPWTKVMMFSADRAGLIACGRLETAVGLIENPPIAVGDSPDPEMRWLPALPPPATRIRALEEFARSAVYARVTALRARQRELARSAIEPAPALADAPADAPANKDAAKDAERIHVPADAWSLARVDARLTARLQLL